VIYVPSRQRVQLLKKTAPTWVVASMQYPGMEVRIVVDEEEVDIYQAELKRLGLESFIEVMADTSPIGGIGAARQTCLEHAAAQGYEFTVQVDDDMKVTPNLGLLVETLARDDRISGAAAWMSYYGLGMGKEGPDIEVNRSSMGLQVKAYRVEPLLSLGGFDPTMKLAEDVDAVMKVAIATGQYPIIHRKVVATPVNQRGDEGGCASWGGHSRQAAATVALLNTRYGEGTASLREHKKTGLPRDTIWMAKFWKRVESGYYLNHAYAGRLGS
jgi:hypothetical protein